MKIWNVKSLLKLNQLAYYFKSKIQKEEKLIDKWDTQRWKRNLRSHTLDNIRFASPTKQADKLD